MLFGRAYKYILFLYAMPKRNEKISGHSFTTAKKNWLHGVPLGEKARHLMHPVGEGEIDMNLSLSANCFNSKTQASVQNLTPQCKLL
jgi:hypothetical protein